MQRIHLNKIAVVIVSILFSLSVASPIAAQKKSTQRHAAAREVVSSTAAGHGGAPQEGIRVHGRWVIEVRDPDGKLVRRRAFENSLEFIGREQLPLLLTRMRTPGFWSVGILGNVPLCTSGCQIRQQVADPSPGTPGTLQVSLSSAGTEIILSGTLIADNPGAIGFVSTTLGGCDPNVPPENCHNFGLSTPNAAGFFTARNLSGPEQISVAAKQIIQVTVTISFS